MAPFDMMPTAVATFDASAARSTPKAPKAAAGDDAHRVGREFEQMFLAQVLGSMFDGLSTDGPFGGGFGEKMFRSLQTDAYARALAGRGGVGIGNQITQEILRAQERPHG